MALGTLVKELRTPGGKLVAQDWFQEHYLCSLLFHQGRWIDHPAQGLRGLSSRYRKEQANSISNMVRRLRECGYTVDWSPGPRGETLGSYRVSSSPTSTGSEVAS